METINFLCFFGLLVASYALFLYEGQIRSRLKMNLFQQLANSLFILSLLVVAVSCDEPQERVEPTIDVVEIPDGRFEAMLIDLHIDSDGIINQKVLKNDVAGITHLNLNHSGDQEKIEDLSGIEGFENLTYLTAGSHLIKHVDLSSNTSLDTLILLDNYLTTIDLSHNPNLIYVDLQVNELVTVEGLSRLSHLKKLDLSFNLLEELIFENESIEYLLASYNQLHTYAVHNATQLENVILTSNKITSIDVTSHKVLHTLVLSGNELETIDLRHNTLLSYLRISSNSLNHLDLTENSNLVELRVDRNPDLTCVTIGDGQEIPSVSLSDYQQLSTYCN